MHEHGRLLQPGVLQPRAQLTKRQTEVLVFIWRYYVDHECYPTHREITSALGAASSNARPWIDGLEKKGILTKVDGRRNIRITTEGVVALEARGLVRQEQLEL
jgi:DNA-binding MarR family transcriptional regulator